MWCIETNLLAKLAVINLEEITVNQQKTAFEGLRQCAHNYYSRYQGRSIGWVEGVRFARRLFRAIGIDPTKHRPASEALLNRALKGRPFYSVNVLVDAGNWCSLDFLLPICVYDSEKIKGQVRVRKGKEQESYIGLNNRIVNLNNRYVISDEIGPFGSPITDSQRTAVDYTTTKASLVIFAPKDYDNVLLIQQAELFAQRAMDICGGRLKSMEILGSNHEEQ